MPDVATPIFDNTNSLPDITIFPDIPTFNHINPEIPNAVNILQSVFQQTPGDISITQFNNTVNKTLSTPEQKIKDEENKAISSLSSMYIPQVKDGGMKFNAFSSKSAARYMQMIDFGKQ